MNFTEFEDYIMLNKENLTNNSHSSITEKTNPESVKENIKTGKSKRNKKSKETKSKPKTKKLNKSKKSSTENTIHYSPENTIQNTIYKFTDYIKLSKDPEYRFDIEKLTTDELDYYIKNNIKMDTSKLPINDEKILIEALNNIYKHVEKYDIMELINLLLFNIAKSPEQIYKERIRRSHKPIIYEIKNTQNKPTFFDTLFNKKPVKVFRRICKNFDDLKEEDKNQFIQQSYKEKHEFYKSLFIIQKYLCLNIHLDTKKFIDDFQFFKFNYYLFKLKNYNDTEEYYNILNCIKNKDELFLKQIQDIYNNTNIKDFDSFKFNNEIKNKIILLMREQEYEDPEPILIDYINDMFNFDENINKEYLKKSSDDYFYDEINKLNNNISKSKSFEIFNHCLNKDIYALYVFRYKRKNLLANFKNYHFDLQLHEKIKKEKKKQKELLNWFNLKSNPEKKIKHRKLKYELLDLHKKLEKEKKDIIKNNKSKSNNNIQNQNQRRFENTINDNFNKEIYIVDGKFVLKNKELNETEKCIFENTKNNHNENIKNNDSI